MCGIIPIVDDLYHQFLIRILIMIMFTKTEIDLKIEIGSELNGDFEVAVELDKNNIRIEDDNGKYVSLSFETLDKVIQVYQKYSKTLSDWGVE